MKLYHSYNLKNGFNINSIDFERGLFCLRSMKDDDWIKKTYPKYSDFDSNEFGDTVVELDVDDNQKTFVGFEQLDVLKTFFSKSFNARKIINKFEHEEFEREDYHKMDKFIGKFLRKKGYKLIHYNGDDMYGDVFVIIDKSVIKGIRFS